MDFRKTVELRKAVEERLDLMIQAGMISENTAAFCGEAAELMLKEPGDRDGEKLNMFITHLAMAADRMERGNTGETAIDAGVFETVRRAPLFGEAVRLRDSILKAAPAEFTEAEADFLTIHLCNLLTEIDEA